MGVYSSPTIEYRVQCVGNELMRVHLKPTTTLGMWSTWLIFAFAVSLASFGILVASGQLGNPILTIPILFAGTSGVAAFITGLISIVKRKERSIAVYLAVTFGLLFLVVWLVVITYPH